MGIIIITMIMMILSGVFDANLDRGSESPLDREGLAASYSGLQHHEGVDPEGADHGDYGECDAHFLL